MFFNSHEKVMKIKKHRKDNSDMKYNILDFGAQVSDYLQTEAIQKTIDTCFQNGGGEVIIPCGVFKTGSIRLRSNITLHLMSGAILEGSRDCEDYTDFADDKIEPIDPKELERPKGTNPHNRWHHAIIQVLNAENVSIIGESGSYINGMNCYDPEGEEKYRGPHAIVIFNSNNITLKGYIVKDSANWAHNIFETQNVQIENVTVYGGHDGIDIRTCDNVTIDNCKLYTGDDAVAGFDNINVVVKNCLLNAACAAFRLGGTDVLIDNCRSVSPARFGFRFTLSEEKKALALPTDETSRHTNGVLFLYYCCYRVGVRRTPGNITIQNSEFDGNRKMFWMNFSEDEKWCCNRALTQIKFKNCKITNLREAAITMNGDENDKITFEVEDTEISASTEISDNFFMETKNFNEINMSNVKIKGFKKNEIRVSGEPGRLNLDNSDEIILTNV